MEPLDIILSDLQSLRAEVADVRKEVSNCRVEIAKLKGRASMWGAMAGLIGPVLYWFFNQLGGK